MIDDFWKWRTCRFQNDAIPLQQIAILQGLTRNIKMAVENTLRAPLPMVLIATALLAFVASSVSSFLLVPIRPPDVGGMVRHELFRNLPQRRFVLAVKKKNNYGDSKALQEFCSEQEARAITATESWIVDATGFLEPPQSSALLDKLEGRADVTCLSVGCFRESNCRRCRCVYANPDLGYDASTADADYVRYLKVDNVALGQCDPWPNILVAIGLDLDTVGDIFVVEDESTVYLAVDPESEKPCTRLLPKELPGTGVTVTTLSKEAMDAEMATIGDENGVVVEEMEVQRVDKRNQ